MEPIKRLDIDEHRRELLEQRQPSVPYHVHEDNLDLFFNHEIPWHWHTLLEFSYILEGEIEYHWSEGICTVRAGQALFINSNTMHKLQPANGQSGCRLRTILFDQHFLSGAYNSTLEQKYFLPVLQCADIQVYPILPDHEQGALMVAALLRAMSSDGEARPGGEFQVQRYMADLWMLLFEQTRVLREHSLPKNGVSVERLKEMITYIRSHFAEEIALSDIAAAAGIGERECLRCFRKTLSISPVAYLNQYRVHMAAQALVQTTKTVLAVSEECGFSSNSYFTKVFRKIMHCTPKEFQQRGGIR